MARIVLTLPEPRATRIAGGLSARGHQVLSLAFSAIEPREGDPLLEQAIACIGEFDRIVFVSPAAIQTFVPRVHPWPGRLAPSVIGPGSLEALSAHGLAGHPGLAMPAGPRYDAAALLELECFLKASGQRILVVRGESGRDEIEETLSRRGAIVEVALAYRSVAVVPPAASRQVLEQWLAERSECEPILWVTAADAIERLAEWALSDPALGGVKSLRTLTIHPRLASLLVRSGWQQVETIAPGLPAFVNAIESVERAAARRSGRAGSISGATNGIERD